MPAMQGSRLVCIYTTANPVFPSLCVLDSNVTLTELVDDFVTFFGVGWLSALM